MVQKQKKPFPIVTILKWFVSVVGFIGVFGFMFKASVEWGSFKQELKNERENYMFDTTEDKVKTKLLVDAPYNKYQLLMARDTIIDQGQHLDTITKSLMGAFDTINKRYANDVEDKIHRIASRKKRDSLDVIQTQQMQELIKDGEIQKGINLQILDELKEIRKHHNN